MSKCLLVGLTFAIVLETTYAVPPNLQIEEVMAGANGDSRVQFIEIKMLGPADRLWGPQSGEVPGRLRLVFYDARGTQTGEHLFSADAPLGVIDPGHNDYSVLIATEAFAELPGMPAPDFIISPRVMAQDGKVCLTHNPANPNAPAINLCLSYGNFVADTGIDTLGQPAGAPAAALPIAVDLAPPAHDDQALRRTANFGNYGVGQYNADFALLAASPRNSAGAIASIPNASTILQGRNLFMFETYNGNGRTCATCHQPDILFGLSPTKISFLKPNDPLFVAELVPELEELENSCLLNGSRALNLENIDGFSNPPVFRGSPNLINLAETAPYGRSGEFANVRTFAAGAVQQHFPRTLARNSNPNNGSLDFRVPTTTELFHMEAFLLSKRLPADGNYDLAPMISAAIARGADAAAIQRGQDLFFDPVGGKCFKCHGPPVLSTAIPPLGGGNQAFNTGVSNLFINASFQDACLGGQPLPPEAGGARTFSTPSLIGISSTAPYFHNNAFQTLRDTVAFYTGPEFNNSPAAMNPLIGTISLTNPQIDDITAFLSALEEPFIDCDGDLADDREQISGGASDCNANGVLDSCELGGNDCNANLIPDECDFTPVKIDQTINQLQPVGSGSFFVTTADVDNDADLDVIAPGWTAYNVQVYLNDSTGTAFAGGWNYPVSSNTRAAAPADYDNDGDVDLVSSNLLANHLTLRLNNGVNGQNQWLGFAGATTIAMNYGGGPPAGSIFVLAHDLNNDGRKDIVVCKNFMQQVSVLINLGPNGQGGPWLGFAAPVDYSTGGGLSVPWSVAAGNLNADNFADLVVADRDRDLVLVYLNNGAGDFGPPVSYPVQDAPESLLLADLNADGKNDVVTANTNSDTLSVLNGNGDGTLDPAVTVVVGSYPFGAQPHSVVAGDMDRDGDLDLVSANWESGNISVSLNDGQGGFATLINLAVNQNPDYAVVGDMNDDDKLDIVAVHYNSNSAPSFSVLLNETPPFGGDCNRNGVPDSCDIQSGESDDLNGNAVPDQCEHLGDFNLDDMVNLLDVNGFVAVLLGVDQIPAHVNSADINGSGAANGQDIKPFLTLILSSN